MLDVNLSIPDKAELRPGRIVTDRAELKLLPGRPLTNSLVGAPPTTSRPVLNSQLVKKTADDKGMYSMSLFEEGLQSLGLLRCYYIDRLIMANLDSYRKVCLAK